MSAGFYRSAVALFIGAVTWFLFAVQLVGTFRFIGTVEMCSFARISLQANPGSKFRKPVGAWLRQIQAAHAVECMKHNPRFLLKFQGVAASALLVEGKRLCGMTSAARSTSHCITQLFLLPKGIYKGANKMALCSIASRSTEQLYSEEMFHQVYAVS